MSRFCLAFIFCLNSLYASEVSVVEVPSRSMKKSVNVSVVLPDSYDSGEKKYPVVYLLHGYKNNHTNWPRHVSKLVDEYQVIAVCPDGNKDSWYFDSPMRPEYRYETFISQELIKFIDQSYRTFKQREKRVIAGASMGGHGAMYLALRNTDVYGAVASMSGGLDIRPFYRGYGIKTHLGNFNSDPALFEEHTAINQIKKIKDGEIEVFLDCGLGDFFLDVNRAFVKELKAQSISHFYEEREGSHGWRFWKDSIKLHMKLFDNYFHKSNR